MEFLGLIENFRCVSLILELHVQNIKICIISLNYVFVYKSPMLELHVCRSQSFGN